MTFFKRFFTFLAVPVVCCGIICFSVPAYAAAPAAPSVDVQPFFLSMPQLPDGYFDGDILADGDNYQISLDFSDLASTSSSTSTESGTISGNGMDRYTITVPSHTISDNYFAFEGSEEYHTFGYTDSSNGGTGWVAGSGPDDEIVFNGTADVQLQESGYTATVSQTADGNESYSGSSSSSGSTDYSGSVSGSLTSGKDISQHHRYRLFSMIAGSSRSQVTSNYLYYWFIVDARNDFYFSSSGYGNPLTLNIVGTYYPSFCYTYSFNGGLNSASFSSSSPFYGSSYSDNSGNGYFWFSPSFPAITGGIPRVREAVFGKETLLFQYLNTIHSDLNTIHSDLTSFQSALTSAISGQTNTLVNIISPGNFDQTSMGNTGSLESLESSMLAPSTDTIFSSDSSSFTSGMGFWRDRMNDLLYFNGSPILPLTVFSLTLGLAAMIIGRRVSGGGSA